MKKTAVEKVSNILNVDRRHITQIHDVISLVSYEKVSKNQRRKLDKIGLVKTQEQHNCTIFNITLPDEEE